jgi:polysaccharide export outer membrane protein
MTRLIALALALALAPLAAGGAERAGASSPQAETRPASVPPPPGEAHCGEEYRVGSGDALQVVVFGSDDLTRSAVVRTDGAVALPLVGDVPVAGATVPEVRDRLTRAFALYLVNPRVDVQMLEYNSRFVALVGEVEQPGRRALRACTRVIDVLLQAGGFRDDASAEVVVSRPEAEELRARVERGVFTPAARRVLETVLQGGEIVTVLPPAYVTVQGEVARPNRYPIAGRLTVTGAVTLAGGLTRSGSSKAKIVRVGAGGDRQVLEADLKAIRDGKAEDLVLQPEDIVTVTRRFF